MNKKGVNVLVVDDDEFMRAYLRDLLEDAGHSVKEARNGDEAIRMVAADAPDLVMLDLLMPEKSGLEALPALLGKRPSLLVIVVSSLDSELLIADALAAGAVDFVTKPFHPTEIDRAVSQALCEGAP